MTTGEDVIPISRNWADEIDEMNRGAMENCLREIFYARSWRRISEDRVAEEKVPAAKSEEKEI